MNLLTRLVDRLGLWVRRLFGHPMECKQCGNMFSWWRYGRTVTVEGGNGLRLERYRRGCPVCGARWWRES